MEEDLLAGHPSGGWMAWMRCLRKEERVCNRYKKTKFMKTEQSGEMSLSVRRLTGRNTYQEDGEKER